MVSREAMLQADAGAAGFAVVGIDAGQLLFAQWDGAFCLSVHPGIIGGITCLQKQRIGKIVIDNSLN
jgi:hypothetical protein